jgi:hypothetical protein
MELLNACVDTIDPSLPTFPTHDLLRLTGYIDAANATDLKTCRSLSSYVFTLAGAGAVAFISKLQATVATSSTKAEFMAAVSAAKVVKHLQSVLHELGFGQYITNTLLGVTLHLLARV